MLNLPVPFRSFVNAQTNGLQTHRKSPKYETLIRAENLLPPYYLCGQNKETRGPLVKKNVLNSEIPFLKYHDDVQPL
jgi:hypothetical protein